MRISWGVGKMMFRAVGVALDCEEREEAVVERMEWKWVSQVGDAPRVAMEETWMTSGGGVVVGEVGMVERICWRPGQPKGVWCEVAVLGFWREGALARKAARMGVKS